MLRSALLVAPAALLLAAAPAGAATRYVDDDGVQCPAAAFSTVQSAVDASGAGDVVRVCAGTYAEQVTVPADKTALQLRSHPAGAAQLVGPAGGLTADPAFPPTFAIVSLRAARSVLDGFRVRGPLTAADRPAACESTQSEEFEPGGVAIAADRANVRMNTISGIALDCADLGFGTPGSGVVVEFSENALVDRNRIEGSASGVRVFESNPTIVGNRIRGTGAGVRSTDFGNPLVRSNDIAQSGTAISLLFSRITAIGNNLHDNSGAGIGIDDGVGGRIERNFVQRNARGISIDFIGPNGIETNVDVIRNNVRDNAGDGISVGGGPRGGFNSFVGNVSLGNGGLDCRDDSVGDLTSGTNDLWVDNIGETDFPNVCSEP